MFSILSEYFVELDKPLAFLELLEDVKLRRSDCFNIGDLDDNLESGVVL